MSAPAEGQLFERLIGFARLLRRAGISIGPGSVIDALHAVMIGGIGTRADFYWTLHATLISRHEHHAVFNEAFHRFWQRDQVDRVLREMLPVTRTEGVKSRAAQRRVEEALGLQKRMPKPPKQQEKIFDMRGTVSDAELLRRKDFAQMSAAELDEARRAIAALRLPDDESETRRFAPSPRGRIDLARTLRASVRAGGGLIELRFRAPRTKRPPLVALVDISGSMSDYSRPLLHFFHALTMKRRNVSTFLFGTRLTNITRALKTRDPDEALALASQSAADWAGGTRIAPALEEFNKRWSRRVLGQGAVVLLVTDGLEREGGGELRREIDRLHRSCRRLVWLNPLLRFDGFEAKAEGIRTMLPHVDELRPVHNLASLKSLCDALTETRTSSIHDPRRWLGVA
ncbi:MAG: VWA domain-containing protein [Xanthobacteraceae bacterium]|nr:VWA domain-containing protein [Xanthobacteraceae bacterium]QYK44154.1 MAG: VWA domain-containing protein [Xanthobacteraceae bacterium]